MLTLITGGAGFIGSHSADALLAAGHSVRIFDDLSTGAVDNFAGKPIEFMQGDVRDAEAVRRAVDGVDAVLHLAALVSVPLSMRAPLDAIAVNATGTAHVLEAARLSPKLPRVVLASTSAVFGDLPGRKDELSPVAPLSPYGASKLMAEQSLSVYSRAYGLPVVRLRYFNVYGPRQRADSPYSGVLARWTAAARADQECVVFGDGEQTRDFVHVHDVARANLAALTAPLPAPDPLFVVATGASVTLNHVLAELGHAAGTALRIRYDPPRSGDIVHSAADSALLRRTFGWSPQMLLREGLQGIV